jgi:hypothetical protein
MKEGCSALRALSDAKEFYRSQKESKWMHPEKLLAVFLAHDVS